MATGRRTCGWMGVPTGTVCRWMKPRFRFCWQICCAANPPAASVTAAVGGLIRAQSALKADPDLATTVAQRVFPPMEAGLIAELIRRDLPYYDPTISPETVAALNQFARDMHFLSGDVPYDHVVATQFAHLWKGQPA